MNLAARLSRLERLAPEPAVPFRRNLILYEPEQLEALERMRKHMCAQGWPRSERFVITPAMEADWAIVRKGLPL